MDGQCGKERHTRIYEDSEKKVGKQIFVVWEAIKYFGDNKMRKERLVNRNIVISLPFETIEIKVCISGGHGYDMIFIS